MVGAASFFSSQEEPTFGVTLRCTGNECAYLPTDWNISAGLSMGFTSLGLVFVIIGISVHPLESQYEGQVDTMCNPDFVGMDKIEGGVDTFTI